MAGSSNLPPSSPQETGAWISQMSQKGWTAEWQRLVVPVPVDPNTTRRTFAMRYRAICLYKAQGLTAQQAGTEMTTDGLMGEE